MKKSIALFALAASVQQCALAETGYYLITTYPNAGEKTVDFKYWNAKPSGKPPRSSPEIGFGYNVTDRWFTEVNATWFAFSPGSQHYVAMEWQNDFMLTQGQYPIDVALHSNYERPRDGSDGHAWEWGPVMQTEIGRTQINFNLLFQKEAGITPSEPWELAYQWQVRQHYKRAFDFGLQGFGEVGQWNDWLPRSQQSHRAGPAVFGEMDVGPKQELHYEAAYLFGKNSAQSARSVTARVRFTFQ